MKLWVPHDLHVARIYLDKGVSRGKQGGGSILVGENKIGRDARLSRPPPNSPEMPKRVIMAGIVVAPRRHMHEALSFQWKMRRAWDDVV